MTKKEQDQISAFVDDELPYGECEFLVRRLGLDAGARKRVLRYSVTGAVLRGESLEAYSGFLNRRLHQAMESDEPEPTAGRFSRAFVAGAGLAAGLAILAIVAFWKPGADAPLNGFDTQGRRLDALQEVELRERPRYGVSRERVESLAAPSPAVLTHYLLQHGEYASGLGRASVNSHLMHSIDFEIEDGTR